MQQIMKSFRSILTLTIRINYCQLYFIIKKNYIFTFPFWLRWEQSIRHVLAFSATFLLHILIVKRSFKGKKLFTKFVCMYAWLCVSANISLLNYSTQKLTFTIQRSYGCSHFQGVQATRELYLQYTPRSAFRYSTWNKY